jgi:hypothetical protein
MNLQFLVSSPLVRYLGPMAWTENQKALGRAELLRRRTSETAATYRKSFFKTAGVCIACLLTIVLGLSLLVKATEWITRSEAIFVTCIAAIGFAITVILSYIRFMDWLDKRSSDRNSFLQPEVEKFRAAGTNIGLYAKTLTDEAPHSEAVSSGTCCAPHET